MGKKPNKTKSTIKTTKTKETLKRPERINIHNLARSLDTRQQNIVDAKGKASPPLIRGGIIGKLLNKDTDKPIAGFTVRIFALEAGKKYVDLGYDISNDAGLVTIIYTFPVEGVNKGTVLSERKFKIEVYNPKSEKLLTTEISYKPPQDKIIEIKVPVPAQADPAALTLDKLVADTQVKLPANLLTFLKQKGINTLADIRRVGGIAHLQGLPVPADHSAIRMLEAHANISKTLGDLKVNAKMIERGYKSSYDIAKKLRTDFVGALEPVLGDFKAAQTQVVARAQTDFMNNILSGILADRVNGFHPPINLPPLLPLPPIQCECRDCEAAVSPLAYLADLLEYSLTHLKNNNAAIDMQFLGTTFHQPFGDLPASCEAMEQQVRQVRICTEVLRKYLQAKGLPAAGSSEKTVLDQAETDYRLAAYTTLLAKIGTSYEEIRLARTADPDKRKTLADRLGIDLKAVRPDELDSLFLDTDQPNQITEQVLEKLFGLVDTTRNPLAVRTASDLVKWQLQHLRTLWKNQDWPADIPSQGRPLIDPDVIGPDDFRTPEPKAGGAGPDMAFDLWLRRRAWVDARIQTLTGFKKQVGGQQVPDIAAMFNSMYQAVAYGAANVTPWANATQPAVLDSLFDKVSQGIDVEVVESRIKTDLNLSIDEFARMMAVKGKSIAWESDSRNENVQDDEWREVYSILVQAQKVKLFPDWLAEEQAANILFGPKEFWISLREPNEGDWPPILSTQRPMIDPDSVKMVDLPEPTAGKRAVSLWDTRKARLEQIKRDLKADREANGFDSMMKKGLGHPNPGDNLRWNLRDLNIALNSLDPTVSGDANTKIVNDLHMTAEAFNRLMAIKTKNDDVNVQNRPTASEWDEVYTILTPARKEKHEFPIWLAEEQAAATGVVYSTALKARLPRWRAWSDTRREWQQALRILCSDPVIDSDLIGPGDLNNPIPGDPIFDLWQARRSWIDTQITNLKTAREAAAAPLAGIDAVIQTTLGITGGDLTALSEARRKGENIDGRPEQLGLTIDAFNYLIRMRDLAARNQPVLQSEWSAIYSISTQVSKRRMSADWRGQEKGIGLTLGPDFFQIPAIDPTVFPPPLPPALPIWRATMDARRNWQDTLQSRMDQQETVIEALQEAVSAAEEITLPMLRDALILATDAVGNNLSAKAKGITDNLMIDAKVSGCQRTTRISQAIETLQGVLFSMRTRQLNDTYPNLDLDADDFDEEWTWLGSYATWRAALFVFIYPDNILLPSLRQWQTPAFRKLVNDLRGNRRLAPEQACEAAEAYAEYYHDICSLRLQASCQTRTNVHSATYKNSAETGYRTLFYMFARGGITNNVYWSTYDAQDASDYSQTFWEHLPGIENIINIIGALPYEIGPEERFIYLFARTQDKTEQKLSFIRYDLEKQRWEEEPTELELPEKATSFTAVVSQTQSEVNPPRVAIRLASGAIYERKLNLDGTDWEDSESDSKEKPLIGHALGDDFIELCAMVEIGDGEFYLLVRSLGGLRYRLFGNFDDGHWYYLGPQSHGTTGSFMGAFSLPGSQDMFVFFGDSARTWCQIVKYPKQQQLSTESISNIDGIDRWLDWVAGVNLRQIQIPFFADYSGMTFYDFLTLDTKTEPHLTLWGGLSATFLNFKKWIAISWLAGQIGAAEDIEKATWGQWKWADMEMQRFNNITLEQALLNAMHSSAMNFKKRAGAELGAELSGVILGLSGLEQIVPTSGALEQGLGSISSRLEIVGERRAIALSLPAVGGLKRIAAGASLEGIAHVAPSRIDALSERYFAYQRTGGQPGLYRCSFSRTGDALVENTTMRAAPVVSGPYDIAERYSESQLQMRRSLVQAAFTLNLPGPHSNLTYLEEAYYFVPMHLAIQLQSRGQYTAALDWIRTVYDYSVSKEQQKIYYGLTLEESLANIYQRAGNWLLDPLNPHAIASTRANTYTRYTMLTLIRCLLEFADAEFTRDTSESVPRARTLYMTALELLDSENLKQRLGVCENVIGMLNINLSDPQWIPVLNSLKRDIISLGDSTVVQAVAADVKQAIAGGGTLASRLGKAREIVMEMQQKIPAPAPMMAVIEEKGGTHSKAHGVLLEIPAISEAIARVGNLAGKDYLHAVSYVSGQNLDKLENEKVDLPWLREKMVFKKGAQRVNGAAHVGGAPVPIAQMERDWMNLVPPTHVAAMKDIVNSDPLGGVKTSRMQKSVYIPTPSYHFCIPPNPILKALRLRTELNLYKLRNCRNIAGMVRQLEPYAAPTDNVSGLPAIGAGGQLVLPGTANLTPTPYRFPVLIERAKQLVGYAQQIEAAMLSALEKRDAEYYNLMKARQDVRIARAGIRLQDLRVKEATSDVKLAELQRDRVQLQMDHYQELLDAGESPLELASLAMLLEVSDLQKQAAIMSLIAAFLPASVPMGPGVPTVSPQGQLNSLASWKSSSAGSKSTQASILSTVASYERRAQEWEFQRTLAQQDVRIADQQIKIAEDHVRVVGQEHVIAEMQAEHSEVIADFLANKFTNVELYDWMSGILERVYGFFLQQATSMAQLATYQLAFERQEVPPPLIQADYWEAPSDGGIGSGTEGRTPDRRGLTGSARLLQDISQLDQYAFETNKRKLQLSKTISLSRLAPVEFQRFRETGAMTIATPMELFDRDFPGHYLRLIRRVKTSVIALIPPMMGIRATLTCSRTSRVVISGDVFQMTLVQRGPDHVALSSPRDATGMFEFESQSEMLAPFEGIGVDTTWEFRMPKAANLFDYRTIAEVLVTIEYTALNSFDYRQQVIQSLNPKVSADRPFSFRHQLGDQWYDLHNPDQTDTPMLVTFETGREDFPPNIDYLKIQHIVLYFARKTGETFEVPVTSLRFMEQNSGGSVGGGATSIDGVIGTRKGNAGSWTSMIGKSPVGEWKLALPDTQDIRSLFKNDDIEDILFVITYSGRTPEWPV